MKPAKPLAKLFHIDSSSFEKIYDARFSSETTSHFDINIQGVNYKTAFPAFFYQLPELSLKSERIYQQLLYLQYVLRHIPNIAVQQFIKSSLIEEIQATNDIEGVRSTRQEIVQALDEQDNYKDRASIRLWGLVNKYLKLLTSDSIEFDTCENIRSFYDDFALQEVLKDDPSNYPDGTYFRKSGISVVSDSKVLHNGVYPEQNICRYMDSALNILHSNDLPLLTRIGLFHYLFGYIHPFYDGNGRTSRFISSYYLSKHLHLLLGVRLSVTIKQTKRFYYKLFEETNHPLNRGDLSFFVLGFVSIVEKSLSETIDVLKEKQQLLAHYRKNLRTILKNQGFSKREAEICDVLLQATLFSEEGATTKEIAEALKINDRTVKNHLNPLSTTSNYVVVNRANRAYRYALNLDPFQSSQE